MSNAIERQKLKVFISSALFFAVSLLVELINGAFLKSDNFQTIKIALEIIGAMIFGGTYLFRRTEVLDAVEYEIQATSPRSLAWFLYFVVPALLINALVSTRFEFLGFLTLEAKFFSCAFIVYYFWALDEEEISNTATPKKQVST